MITLEFAFDIGDQVRIKATGRLGRVWHLFYTHERRQRVMVEDETGAILGVFNEEQLIKATV